MKQTADITLIQNSTAGNPPKVYRSQTVEIIHESDTIVQSVDGHVTKGSHPSTITWFGARLEDLVEITDVKIVTAKGDVLVDGELNTFQGAPHQVGNGVRFFVLRCD
jgi:hypothetical protein